LRVGFERGRLAFDIRLFAPSPDELIHCGHNV
jgi:hypothetical protein